MAIAVRTGEQTRQVQMVARVIVAVRAQAATGHAADGLPVIIDRAKWLRHRVAEIVADAGYASDAVYTDLAQRRIEAFMSP
jgi:hypothetical protein